MVMGLMPIHDHAAHGHDTDFKRTDVRGSLQARYAPNDRLSFTLLESLLRHQRSG